MELPGIGWMSMIIDPTGAALALWKPASAWIRSENSADKPPNSRCLTVLWSAGACSRFRNARRWLTNWSRVTYCFLGSADELLDNVL